jgi:hypothetical protein
MVKQCVFCKKMKKIKIEKTVDDLLNATKQILFIQSQGVSFSKDELDSFKIALDNINRIVSNEILSKYKTDNFN